METLNSQPRTVFFSINSWCNHTLMGTTHCLFQNPNNWKNLPLAQKPICSTACYPQSKLQLLQRPNASKIHTLPVVVCSVTAGVSMVLNHQGFCPNRPIFLSLQQTEGCQNKMWVLTQMVHTPVTDGVELGLATAGRVCIFRAMGLWSNGHLFTGKQAVRQIGFQSNGIFFRLLGFWNNGLSKHRRDTTESAFNVFTQAEGETGVFHHNQVHHTDKNTQVWRDCTEKYKQHNKEPNQVKRSQHILLQCGKR